MLHTPAQLDCEEIYNLSLEYMDPEGTEWAMKNSLQAKLKLQDKVILKDEFMCLKNVGTNEIQCSALKMCNKVKFEKEKVVQKIVKFVMNIKIDDVNRDILNEKRNVQLQKKNMDNIVRPNTFAGKLYRKCVKNRLEQNWKTKKEKSGRKINHLKNKFKNKVNFNEKEGLPESHCGVKLKDDDLGSIESNNKANVHPGVELSQNERVAVDVLPKDTFFNNIYKKEAEQQAEVSFAKMRWNEKRKKEKEEEVRKVFDADTNIIDLSNKKVTEMRSNQRVKLIDPDIDDEKEIKRDNLKLEIVNTYGEYIDEHCNKKGEIKSAMSEEKREGLDNVKSKIEANELKIIPTDKTNKVSVMLPKTYLEGMKEHHEDDEEISKKELNKTERKLSDHSKSLTKIFKVAEQHGQHKRAMGNATVHVDDQIPTLKGSEKDHKVTENNDVKMRPIVNAMDGPKKNISDIFSDIGAAIVESNNDGVLCFSTEELLESFESFNRTIKEKDTKRVVGSMDATSLYPSVEVEQSADIIKHEVMRSSVTFDNIDTHELGIYLKKCFTGIYY